MYSKIQYLHAHFPAFLAFLLLIMSPLYAYPATLHLVVKPGVSVVVTGGLVGVTGASVVTGVSVVVVSAH